MTTSLGGESSLTRRETEGPSVILVFSVNRSPDVDNEILQIDKKEALSADLNRVQAASLFMAAWRAAGDASRQLDRREKLAERQAMSRAEQLFWDIFTDINSKEGGILTSITEVKNERAVIQEYIHHLEDLGILDMEKVVDLAQLNYLTRERGEFSRIENRARADRLGKLGFYVGLGEAIVGFQLPGGEFIEYPRPNLDLPENQINDDWLTRAGAVGFIVDDKGRVSGFKDSKGKKTEIPEDDRQPQKYFTFRS